MPKELFDQSLIESPVVPNDNDRLAFSQPGAVGGINIKWGYFKTVIQDLVAFLGQTVGISTNDTTPNYLNDKISVSGTSLTKTILNPSANEQIELDIGSTIIGAKTFDTFPITPSSAPTTDYQVANKKFVEDSVVGLWDDRGNYDASSNLFPSTGGSGPAGAILKGDIWTISVGGTLGGETVVPGQTVRALVDIPGQTAGNWAINEVGANDNVGVTGSDTTPNFLNNKLSAGTNISLNILNPGANEQVQINATGGGGAATQLEQGSAYTFLGGIFNDDFPGTTLNATKWTGGLPTGASVNNDLIIASGSAAWDRYIQLAKHYLYEKEDIIVDMTATTKSSGDAWGWHQSTILTLYNEIFYWKFDQNTGILSLGTTIAANEIGAMQPIDFTAGDNLKFTWKRKPDRTVVIIENITQAGKNAVGEFPVSKWGTEGYYRLTFLGGQQTFHEVTIDSTVRDYGSNTDGVVFIDDSIGYGVGASSIADRWTNLLMKNQTTLFENLSVNSWLSGTVTASRLTEILSNIDAKYLVCNLGYNDKAQSVPTGTYQTNLQTIATTAQGLGYTVIFVSPWPDRTSSNIAYVTAMQAAAIATSSTFIDISSAVGYIADDNYLEDGVHPNDSGHKLMADSIELQGPEFYEDILTTIDNEDIQLRGLGFSNEILPILGLDQKGRGVWLDSSKFANKNTVLLQANVDGNDQLYNQQVGNIGIDGRLLNGKYYHQKNSNGLQVGFNKGVNDLVGSNINITNVGIGGIGFPQQFDTMSGQGNIKIWVASPNRTLTSGTGTVSGDNNIIFSSHGNTDLSGDWNILMSTNPLGITTASNNFWAGQHAGKNIQTGRGNIHLWNFDIGGFTNFSTSLQDTIIIGDFSDISGIAARGIVSISATRYVENKFYFGGAKGLQKLSFHARKRTGTNANGWAWDHYGSTGTGIGTGGVFTWNISNSVGSGTAEHSTFTEEFKISQGAVTVGNVLKAGQFTATEASALTPADADFIYVTSTNGTFTSVGFWGYENGTWAKL